MEQKGKKEIRIANKNDAEFIALLGRVTFTETFGHLFKDKQDLLNYFNATFSVDKIENSIAKRNNVYWIAFGRCLPTSKNLCLKGLLIYENWV
jgi:hypothetical protein